MTCEEPYSRTCGLLSPRSWVLVHADCAMVSGVITVCVTYSASWELLQVDGMCERRLNNDRQGYYVM